MNEPHLVVIVVLARRAAQLLFLIVFGPVAVQIYPLDGLAHDLLLLRQQLHVRAALLAGGRDWRCALRPPPLAPAHVLESVKHAHHVRQYGRQIFLVNDLSNKTRHPLSS